MKLPALLDIAQAKSLHQELAMLLEKKEDITLDGSEVKKADAAALQIIAGAKRQLTAANKKLSIINPSETLMAALKISALDKILELT